MAFASTIEIDGLIIGKDEPTYFIADIGANFDGDLGKAKQLAYEVKQAGAQVAKIQSFQANKIVSGAGFASMRLRACTAAGVVRSTRCSGRRSFQGPAPGFLRLLPGDRHHTEFVSVRSRGGRLDGRPQHVVL